MQQSQKDWTGDPIHVGQKVLTRANEEIGSIHEILTGANGTYLRIIRYGAGQDELFVPTTTVLRVVSDHIYLNVDSPNLLGDAWHHRPEPLRPAS